MNKFRLYDKAMAVVKSVEKAEQLPMAEKFAELCRDRLEEIGSEFCREARWEITRALIEKRSAMDPVPF